jgi:archaeosine-15-forming tRNA-guanine transglycosylase
MLYVPAKYVIMALPEIVSNSNVIVVTMMITQWY